jgi:RNA polymerase sigma-70 factor, ECF subfamily
VSEGAGSRGADAVGSSDADLLAATARGDARAYGALVQRYFRPVHGMVWRMMKANAEAEDVAQEAFIKLWRNPGQVREPKALRGWLMRVASNGAIDRMRRQPHAAAELIEELPDPKPNAARRVDGREARSRIDGALAELPERQRLALTLVYFEGLGNMEAAEVMEISVDAVESLLARAKRGLKDGLAEEWRMLLEEVRDE